MKISRIKKLLTKCKECPHHSDDESLFTAIKENLEDYFHHVIGNPLHQLIGRIKRFFFWGWKLRDNHDFDGAFLLEVIEIKLQRMHDGFKKYGHCLWTTEEVDPEYPDAPNRMALLREAIQLAKKLRESDSNLYLKDESDAYFEKWGHHEMEFSEEDERGFSRCTLKQANVITEEDKVKSREEFHVLMEQSYAAYCKDRKRLFDILEQNIDHFWD